MNYLVSFGDDYFKYQKQRLRKEAESTGWFEDVLIHSPETLSEFFEKHKDFVENSRGYGYWIWKPYIILSLLEAINEGDVVFYIDSGGAILPHREQRFNEYLELLNENPVIVFADGGKFGGSPEYKERFFQKMRVLKRFGLENNENFLNSGQVEGGVVICKKSEESIQFVREWLDLVTEDNYCLVNDEDDLPQTEDFILSRHDQSILSILSKQKDVNILGLTECYGMGPFFSSRMTDDGLRARAPDGFRKEPEYSDSQHFTWRIYLENENVKEFTINQIKNLFVSYGEQLVFQNIDFDLKNELVKNIMVELERMQYGKGLYKIHLIFDESPEHIAQNKDILVGEFYCEFSAGDSRGFNFQITSDGVSFPETKTTIKKLYKSEYTRTWDCNW